MSDQRQAWQLTKDEGYNTRITALEQKIEILSLRLDQNNGSVHPGTPWRYYKQMAAQTQATNAPENLYAPLRSDTRAVLDLAAFARRLLDPSDPLYTNVSSLVRKEARKALGVPE